MLRKPLSVLTVLALCLVVFQLATLGCPVPKPVAINPAGGTTDGPVKVTITGTGFHRSTSVKLTMAGQPDIMASEVSIAKDKTQLTCTLDLRNKAVGKWNVVVKNRSLIFGSDGNHKTGTLSAGFTVEHSAPSITSVTPDHALNNGKISVVIAGNNFKADAAVKLEYPGIKEIAASDVTVTAAEIKCVFDLAGVSPGKYNLTVTNKDGLSNSLNAGFTVAGNAEFSMLKPILFDYDKYNIRVDQVAVLNSDISEIKATPYEYIVLGGHSTEQSSNKEYNLILSSKRAEAVKERLVAAGIDPEKIIVFAYGSTAATGQIDANCRVNVSLWQRKPSKEEAK